MYAVLSDQSARALDALLRHLDGSQIVEADDLIEDVATLAREASLPGGGLPLDLERLQDALAEVGQRYADAGM